MTEPPLAVIDRADALARIGGDEALLQTLIEVFLAGCEGYVRDLDGPFAAGDWPGFIRGAHTLKGALATLSAHRARDRAAALERAARAGDRAASEQLLAELRQELARLLPALKP